MDHSEIVGLKEKTIIINDVEVDIYSGANVGISWSNGADSTLLLYLLMSHATQHINIFTVDFLWEGERQIKLMKQNNPRLELLKQRTNNYNVSHFIVDYDDPKWETDPGEIVSKRFNDYKLKLLKSSGIELVYIANNANPPIIFPDAPNGWNGSPYRDPNEHRPTYKQEDSVYFHDPFTNINKRDIASLYRKLDIMDLFDYTRSCDWDPDWVFKYGIEDPGLGHCGVCWHCREREWGFGRL